MSTYRSVIFELLHKMTLTEYLKYTCIVILNRVYIARYAALEFYNKKMYRALMMKKKMYRMNLCTHSRLVGLEQFTLIRPHIATRLSNQTTPFRPGGGGKKKKKRKKMMMNRRLSHFFVIFLFRVLF